MAANPMTFYPNLRIGLRALVTGQSEGRGVAPLTLQLEKNGAAIVADAKRIDVHLAGPGDVVGLDPSTIVLMVPPPHARDAETTKLVHADLRAADLPWRYSPDAPPKIRPWLALLVGTREEFSVAGNILSFKPGQALSVLRNYDFAEAERWAHVQETPNHSGEPRRIARLVGLRGQGVAGQPSGLRPQTEYIAAIVATFTSDGQPAWGSATQPETLPVYHSWTFWTGEEGDFETLATAIRPRSAGGLGKVDLSLPRLKDPATGEAFELPMRGAIGSLADEPSAPAALAAALSDLESLRIPAIDQPPAGHPPRTIIGLPDYDRPWLEDATAALWSTQLNTDPRLRGTAGLGIWIGREAQEDLVEAAVNQMGALQAAMQRIAHLAIGLEVARTLWNRRLPKDKGRRLRIFGPATARIETEGGSVQSAVTGPDSPLPQALLTSAAMRVLRRGTARTRGDDGSPDGAYRKADAIVDAANAIVPPPPAVPVSPFDMDAVADAIEIPRLDDLVVTRPIPQSLSELIDRYVGRSIFEDWLNDEFMPEFRQTITVDYLSEFTCDETYIIRTLLSYEGKPATRAIFCEALTACRIAVAAQGGVLVGGIGHFEVNPAFLGCALSPVPPPVDARRPRNLDLLVERISEMVDPNKHRAPGWRRVESTIDGIQLDTLGPPEMPVGIDLPTWTLLNRHDKEWLLPGVGSLEKHSVIALKTNPRFMAAFMAGLNSQFIAEMHWRNLPVDRTCTPLLQFWGQFDYAEQRRQSDILPINQWDTTRPLGDKAHQWVRPGDPTGREDVVFVFRTDLFRRYPATLVYLSRRTNDKLKLGPDLSAAQAAQPPQLRTELGPIYQGEIEPDIVFFAFDIDPATLNQYQLVLDEPPAEMRFRNDVVLASGDNGAILARKTIDRHSRVAFLGSHLAQQGLAVP